MWNPEPEDQQRITWKELYQYWSSIKLDFQEQFGVDLDDDEQRARVSWHWFSFRVAGLIASPPRAFAPNRKPLPSNRLQWALMLAEK